MNTDIVFLLNKMNLISKLSSKCFPKRISQYFWNINETNRKYYSSIKLNKVLSEAQKEIRVPLSHFNVKHLLKDQFDLKVFTINKVNTKYISESNHPIVEIARDMFGSEEIESKTEDNTYKYSVDNTGTLLLLLLAKVSESLPLFKSNETIAKKQYDFVQIYEMINKALFIHNAAVVDIPSLDSSDVSPEGQSHLIRLNDANKISILGGDYLLSYAIVRLANLVNNTAILQLIMCAIDDYCIGNFKNIKDRANGLCIPSNNMSAVDWEEMAGYSLTKLNAYCSQIMLLLAKQSDRYQKAAFDFGFNLQLIWSLKDEIENLSDSRVDSELKLMSAPVIFHMQYDKNFHEYLTKCVTSQRLDFAEIRQIVSKGPAIDKCNRYLEFYTNKAIKSLDVFPESNAKLLLKNVIFA